MKLNIKIEKPKVNELNNLVKDLKNSKDILTDIGEIVVEDIRQRIISTKQDINDKPFAPWAESTRKAREKRGSAALGILHETGDLADSINYKVVKNKLQIGSTSSYLQYLNFGTPVMPAREVMGFSKRSLTAIDELLNQKFGGKKK